MVVVVVETQDNDKVDRMGTARREICIVDWSMSSIKLVKNGPVFYHIFSDHLF